MRKRARSDLDYAARCLHAFIHQTPAEVEAEEEGYPAALIGGMLIAETALILQSFLKGFAKK